MATPRSFDEAIGSDDDSSALNGDPARKRQRLSSARSDNQHANDDSRDDNESDGPVLPDGYRRSPQSARPTHQPGSIVRVTLRNFVTYTNAEFHPGPNLNMVIGPNGTGKSTLVCAICLGLGWSTVNLGRAKDIGEFVKHGASMAMIEIELARDPRVHRNNPIITTRITKDGNKTEFLIDNKKASKKDVLKLANDLSIQVDNLCQFLPQDRVVEFASLSPVQLLVQTQRAAAPEHVSQMHDELKILGKETKTKQDEQQKGTESLKKLKDRQRAQQADVERIREHSGLQERLAALQKFRPFPQYTEKKEAFTEAKRGKRDSEKQLARLQRQLEPSLRALEEKKRYASDISAALQSKRNTVKRTGDQVLSINRSYAGRTTDIGNKQTQYEVEKNNMKKKKASIDKYELGIRKIQADMKNEPPAIDTATMNQEIRDMTRELRSIEAESDKVHDSLRDLNQQRSQRVQAIEQKVRDKQHMHSQLGKQASRLAKVSAELLRGYTWVEENKHKFTGPVYGPVMLTCSVKDKQNTAAVEMVLGRQSLISFTVTNKVDFDMLQDQFYKTMHLRDAFVRKSERALDTYTPPMSKPELMELGLEGYVVDLLDGPDHVLAMLCDNSAIDSVGYTSKVLNARQTDKLNGSAISSFVTPKEQCSVIRRREYGPLAVSTRVNALRPASFFTDTPVDRDEENRLDRKMLEMRGEIDMLKEKSEEESAKLTELNQQRRTLQATKKEKEDTKAAKQALRTAWEALPTTLEGLQSSLADAKEAISQYRGVCNGYEDELDQLYLDKGQLAVNLAKAAEQYGLIHMELLAMELMEIEAVSDHQQLEQRHATDAQQLEHHRAEVKRLIAATEALKEEALVLQNQCRTIGDNLSEGENTVYDEIKDFKTDQLELEIQSAEARLEINTGGGNRNIIKEFEEREKQIERRESQLEDTKDALEQLTTKIQHIRERWEPLLRDIIDKISASFAENFASINCAGEVDLYKDDEDFEQWAIQIKVKFREQEPLSLLDSHRQSGGERAVSTIFYLMALQSLARAPFRVVDEINQGMDPRNERLVHSRLVSIACQAAREDGSGGSQYFLITPKLLSNLEYHPNMKVHCIASGEWMPSSHASLDFQKLADRALALRAGQA